MILFSACHPASAFSIARYSSIYLLFLLFSPDHLIHHTCVALDNLHNLSRYVLIYIIRHRQSVIAIKVHLHRCVYSLQQAFFVNACEHEAAFVQRFRALRRGADAHRRECMADACEEVAFLRQCTGIRYYSKGVHLQAVVIMEAQRLMLNYALVQSVTRSKPPAPTRRSFIFMNCHLGVREFYFAI